MKRLIYISTARRPMMPTERDHMLRGSRRRNAAMDVTGLLVCGGRRYLQALEGPDDAVASTFDRLQNDARHFAIVTLIDERIAERAFVHWSMGYQDGGFRLGSDASLADIVEDLVAPIGDVTIKAYFRGFAEQHTAPPAWVKSDRSFI